MNPSFSFDCSREMAELYIETIAGSADAQVTFQTFSEDKAGRSNRPAMILHGALSVHWEQLVQLNKDGHGIFMMVNEGDLHGRSAAHVRSPRALFIDDDGKGPSASFAGDGVAPFHGPAPTLTVQSKAGQHNYFLLVPDEPLAEFTAAQLTLAEHFCTDKTVKDVARVMRVPGFFHMKDPEDPFLVKVVRRSATRYRLDEVIAAYPSRRQKAGTSDGVSEGDRKERVRLARAHVEQVPPAVEGQNGDNATFSLCCSLIRGFDLTDVEALEALRDWNTSCNPPWSLDDLMKKFDRARRHGAEAIGGRLKPNGPSARRTEDIAFLVPSESFVYRSATGSWSLTSAVKEAGAKSHLIWMGYTPKEAARVIAEKSCLLAHGVGCRAGAGPFFEEGGRSYLNSYVPSNIVPEEHPWPTIESLISTITGGDEQGIQWLLNWMAFKVQNPTTRSMTALVLQGAHGTGKSLLGVVLGRIIGLENTVTISQRDLENSFNEPYASKLLVLADEVVNRDNLVETSSKLKQMITDPKILVNGKHQRQVQTDNRMTWIFTSNNATPVRVEGETDRRFTVFSTSAAPSDDYKRMLALLFDASREPTPAFVKEMQGFAFALARRQVDREMAIRPYLNAAREDLANASRSSPELFFQEVLERGILNVVAELGRAAVSSRTSEWDFHDKGVVASVVYQAYRAFCVEGGYSPMTASNFGRELRQRHPEWQRRRMPVERRPWVYVGMPRVGSIGEANGAQTCATIGITPVGPIAACGEGRWSPPPVP